MKISLFLGIVFVMRIQPLVIIGILIRLVIFYSLDIYLFSLRFWFGYILILILLSGVLVIFTYIIRLIPNENFEYLGFIIIFRVFLFLFLDEGYTNIDEQRIMGSLLWGGIIGGYIIFLGVFLFRIIVIVIFLRNPLVGALRL